jgi:hypothetical protein
MKLLPFVLFLFLISSNVLYSATSHYVKVTSVKSKNQLKKTKRALNSLGLSMIYKRIKGGYYVYSGPYKTQKYAKYATKKIKRYFPYAKLLKPKVQQEKTITQLKVKKKKENKRLFVGFSLGYSLAPPTHNIEEGTVKIIEPKNSGLSYDIDGGYVLDNNFVIGMGYLSFDADDIKFSNIYGMLEYRCKEYKDITPFLGLLGGYSTLAWSTDPIENPTQESNNDSASPFMATKAGIIYSGLKNIDVTFGYKCMFMSHATNIELDSSNKSRLEHKTLHSIELGIQYKF